MRKQAFGICENKDADKLCIRNAVALRDACHLRVSSCVPNVLGLLGLLMEDKP